MIYVMNHAIGAALLGSVLVIAAVPPATAQQEDFRTRQLMQDVAELKRVVREQEQRIDQLEREVSRSSSAKSLDRGAPRVAERSPQSRDAPWLNSKNWDRVQAGMSETQVLDILGYPTSARSGENSATKTLFYTVPVGDSGFLSGRVELENGSVRTIQRPALR